ncbi:MAG: class I SAM-dependent methyltransferase [Bryobacteraceae bacterium]
MPHRKHDHKSGAPDPIGAFVCNICGCGAHSVSTAEASERERAGCLRCGSSIRFRSIVLALSRALFGLDLTLPQFPVLKSLRGLGFSDSAVYSGRLENHFSYTNTFYDRDPSFDLARPDEKEFGKYDFVICSEVLEHVLGPVDRAFATLARLLKPTGVLILTVPYSLEPETIEHYPESAGSGFAEVDGRTVLVSRSASGEYRVFDQLTFHGGSGSTLERRIFSEEGLRAGLAAAGFPIVRFELTGNRNFGVIFATPWSLPVIAARAPFALSASGVTELVKDFCAARAIANAVKSSRWLRLGRTLGVGPDLK